MKNGIELIFKNCIESERAESITVYEGPLEKGDPAEAVDSALFLEGAAAGDVYSYKLDRQGFYVYTGVVEFTEVDEAAGRREILYRLDRRRKTGYEAVFVSRWTDEVEDGGLFSLDGLNVDGKAPDTPGFTGDKGLHQFASMGEVRVFLRELCGKAPNLTLFSLDEGGENKRCPVVIGSEADLSGEVSLKAALEKLKRRDTMKVLYQAQVHGNEPASGEGALAVLKYFAENGAVLENLCKKMDFIVIPRVNIDGSSIFSRWQKEKLDLNRDALLLRAPVTRAIHHIFNVLRPEVFIDGHEFSGRKRQTKACGKGYILDSLDDILITCVDHLNRDGRIFEIENGIMLDTVDFLREEGFRSFFFPGSFAVNTYCGYARQLHCLSFLVESNGIRRGKLNFARRVLSQREAVLHILQKSAEQADLIRKTAAETRSAFIERGVEFDRSSLFVLEQKTKEEDGIARPRKSFDFRGRLLGGEDRQDVIFNRGEVVRKIARPAAYLIPETAKGAARAVEILSANGVQWYRNETGDYVFPMNQFAANLIAASLEPELGDVTPRNGSFVQAEILGEDGKDPVKRIMRNADETQNKR